MRVFAINGSPKAKNSCTDKILNPLLQGMQEAGADIERVYLATKKIHHCTGCFACWFQTPGRCVIKDDMASLLEQIKRADLLIYGTPLYTYSMSGLMKDFVDRSLPLENPFYEQCGLAAEQAQGVQAKMVLVSPCGFPMLDNFDHLVGCFKRMFRDSFLDAILRPTAELMNDPTFHERYEEYARALVTAGKEYILEGTLSADTKKEVMKLWMSSEEYFAHCKKVVF